MILHQVNRFFLKRNFVRQLVRSAHNGNIAKVLYPLESRSLLRITGNEAAIYLQGLITNDMQHFEEGSNSMYTMFLNNKGRVLYDVLIHKWENNQSYMIECDKNIISLLQKHLKMFKLKRKLDIEDMSAQYKVWALISPDLMQDSNIDNLNLYKDPRISDLGYRILSTNNVTAGELHTVIGKDAKIEESEIGYKYLRYQLGVSEGAEDLPPGVSFPLEANCDYLHGVSFHKGCYVGQELTARVHHTGVVRKRIMPLKFKDVINENIEKDSVILDGDKPKSNLGKLKSYVNDCGLALVRIKEALDAKALKIGSYSIEVVKPSWWPIEASKEKSGVTKLE